MALLKHVGKNHNKPILIWDKKWTEQTILDQVEMFIYLFRMSQIAGPTQANSQHPDHARKNVREEALG